MTDEEEKTLVGLLSKCIPGKLPSAVFESVGRISVYPAIEVVPLRLREGKVEVLLMKRDATDPIWPDKWHTPGTVLRPTDNSISEAFERLMNDELPGMHTEPIYIGNYLVNHARGKALCIEHLLVMRDETGVGQYFNVDMLPAGFIQQQKPALSRAVKLFKGIMETEVLPEADIT